MNYLDKGDNKVKIKMMLEGKIKVDSNQFKRFVEEYYRKYYNIDGNFMFLMVEYEHYDENYKAYSVNEDKYIYKPKNRKIKDLLPFLVTKDFDSEDVRNTLIKIPGVIEDENLNMEINSVIPEGIINITSDKLVEIANENGYGEPVFEHYFCRGMDYPCYNVFARQLNKKIDFEIVDQVTSRELEERYMDSKLRRTGNILKFEYGKFKFLDNCSHVGSGILFQEYNDGDNNYVRVNSNNIGDDFSIFNNNGEYGLDVYWFKENIKYTEEDNRHDIRNEKKLVKKKLNNDK